MIPKLPLHSPRWRELDGVETGGTHALLAQLAQGDEAWRRTWEEVAGGLLDDGVLADGAYAALPHLVEAAAALPPERTADLWVDLGLMVTADYRPPVPADLREGFAAALRLAERAAVRSLLATDAPALLRAHLALAGVAFAGHHTGEALGRLLDPRASGLQLVCPECESDTEIPEFFAVDPAPVGFEAPEPPGPAEARPDGHPWGAVAAGVREGALGEGWEPFVRVARKVAVSGVTPETPGPAVLCLVAGAVVAGGAAQPAAGVLARRLMALTGSFRCWDCERTWTIADGLAENPDGARSQEAPAGSGGPAGSVLSDESVEALAVVSLPGRPALVAGAGDAGAVYLWDLADGRVVHAPPPGHPDRVRVMTALPLPDGRVRLATGGDSGTVAVWDPVTGRPVREPAGDWRGGVTGMCAATVPDGRTLLVTSTPAGAVRLWEPDTGECVGRLNPYGSPIRSVTAVPIAPGHTLVAASDTAGRVHVWDPAVDDPWDSGAAVPLDAGALAAADHRAHTVATVPVPGRAVLATGDDRGVVMLWDLATGTRAGDGLPASTGTFGPPLITATTLPDGRTVLVTGARHGHRLRVWEPATGALSHLVLDVKLTCLAATGADLIVGHDRGVLRAALT